MTARVKCYRVAVTTALKSHVDEAIRASRASEAVRQALCDAAIPDEAKKGTIEFEEVENVG